MLLQPPLAAEGELTPEGITTELWNSVQSILGYVVRWIDQGIGCSKVPDTYGVAIMEDRATLRISSQLLANWLLQRVITEDEVDAALQRLARVVDEKCGGAAYEPLSFRPEASAGIAYTAARRPDS